MSGPIACLSCGAPVPPADRWYLVTTDGDLVAVDLCDECWIEAQVEARCAEMDRD